jgi:hypothetical protein
VDEIRVSCYETARPASVGRLVYWSGWKQVSLVCGK